jgi:hypothetical protein
MPRTDRSRRAAGSTVPKTTSRPSDDRTRRRHNAWNLLLLVPFLMLVTPWFNTVEPKLHGMPFFYWSQFAWVPVAVACLAVVHVKTGRR